MTWLRRLLYVCCLAALTASAFSRAPKPEVKTPSDEVLKTIEQRTDKLAKVISSLRRARVAEHMLADVEVYYKAAVWILKHNEFYNKDSANWTLAVLDRGLLRASQIASGETPWRNIAGRSVARGYRSGVDGSYQPYAVTLPANYGKDPAKKWRLDVVLHGRQDTLTEVEFLYKHNNPKDAPKDLDQIILDVYGRGNNAFRWAGESDVSEALENFVSVETILGRGNLLDPDRRVLRGFSMGGAGTWHLGLHYPDRWCVIGPGAGFTTTKGYVADLKLTPTQEACLHIYDAIDYAENAADVPIVAYSGEKDKQKKAADNIEERLKALGLSKQMTHLIGPGLEHKFPDEWKAKAEVEYAKYAAKGRDHDPKKVRFVTWTLRYNTCQWVEVLSLEKHYQEARVEAEKTDDGFTVKTTNIRVFDLRLPPGSTREPIAVDLDGQKVKARPYAIGPYLFVYLEKRGDRWFSVLPEKVQTDRLRTLQKVAGLQGPIDDAFMTGFLCVIGGGDPWHEGTQKYADENLARFKNEWSKYMRGDLPVKKDEDVTPEDIATRHLILFGDPSSNSLIADVLPSLPLTWTKETIHFDGKDYASAEHVPVLIYPSPLNAERYVILNSGHTFHAEDFEATNARLYPRLGDFALLKLTDVKKAPLTVEVLRAGLFDDHWRWPSK
jgi:pimeloyl-ACP methyl ester carboxylesterase